MNLGKRCRKYFYNLSLVVVALLFTPAVGFAQAVYPLGSTGSMGLGSPNGEFTVAQDDLVVKVPGGYARINRDYDGSQWVLNRQWSGLGDPSFYRSSYGSLGAFYSCTSVNGISSCDSTALAGQTQVVAAPLQPVVEGMRVPSDPTFGRDADGKPKPKGAVEFLARKGVGFSPSSDGTSYVSSKYPRFLVRPQQVPTLPASAGADVHPLTGKPGNGGVVTSLIDGYRWIDRSGQWIEYDQYGRITSYGDRNDVRVWFQYGSHGQIERVLDDNGRTVFTLLYKENGKFVTEVRDHTGAELRRVQYHYSDNGYLDRVTDARGGETRFGYGRATGELQAGGGTLPPSGNSEYSINQVIDAEGRELKVEYGITKRIAKITAPDGGKTEIDYAYDKLKKEFGVTLKLPQTEGGRTIDSQRYDVEGRLVYREVAGKVVLTGDGTSRDQTYIDQDNRSTRIQRDTFGEITKLTYADGSSESFTYASGSTDVREVIDGSGVAYRYEYDDHGNLTRSTKAYGKPEQQVREYTYGTRGEILSATIKGGQNPDGTSDADLVLSYEYDAHGNPVLFTDGERKQWRYAYDSQGNRIGTTDPLGREWTASYDAHSNLIDETDPTKANWHYEFDKTDRLTATLDARGKRSTTRYDAAGRKNALIDPYGAAFTDEYDVAGRLRQRRDASGQSSALSYDSSGRIAHVTDGGGLTTSLDYAGVDGQDRGARQPSGIRYPTFERKFRYDARKQPVQQADVLPDDTRINGIAYDVVGRIKTLTDPNGHARSYEYDALGRLTAVIDQLGNTVALAYDHRDNVIAVTNERGKTTRLVYDGRGLLISETNPLGQTTRYVYDDAGNLAETLLPGGAKIVREYDSVGRIQLRSSHRGDGTQESSETFTWDSSDNLTTWSNETANGVLAYDDADRLLSETVTQGAVVLRRQYTYHSNGNVKTYTGPDGVTLTYSYDGYGNLSRLDIPDEGAISVTERNWNRAKKVVLPGGSVQERAYDGLLNLTGLKVKSPGQVTVFELVNRFGKLSELVAREADGKETEYDYDEALRLVKADAGYAGGASETFVIDAAGNRIQHSAVSGAWTYDDANRLLSRGTFSYSYDAAGRLSQRVDSSKSEPARTTYFSYDGLDRLAEVRDGSRRLVARYRYDPFDQRISKELGDGTKTLYLHGEEGLLTETDAAGAIRRSYGWAPDGLYATAPLFQRTKDGYFYYHNDHQGTPWRVTNKGGAVVWSVSGYTAYGSAAVTAGAQIEQPWRLAGQYFDEETGLHYNLRRYYDAQAGRYISEDPLRFDAAINFYAYGNNSPGNFIDPTGEFAFLIPLAASYLRCVGLCMLLDAVGDAINGECLSLDALGDCAKDCILGMLPLPTPCNKKLGQLVNGLAAAGSALSDSGLLDGAAGGLADSVTNSFPGETVVQTPAGNKRIDTLRPGDEVLAYAEWEGRTRTEKITEVILSHREQTLVTITLDNGNTIETTGGHPLHTPAGWRVAQLLQAGGQLDIKGPDGNLIQAGISKVASRKEVFPVYNLEVANSHNFYVGVDGVLAHNGSGLSQPGTYEFPDQHNPGRYYSGKAANLADRTGKWKRKGRCGIPGINPMGGSSDLDRRIQEQMQINARGGVWKPGVNDASTTSSNLKNSISPDKWSQHGISPPSRPGP
ncbi:RHS repeat-associated core domain-containing protein [Xanthomonas arboricola]|nr:RHS repeat-associated core domain-containing protein [Xanthomonas arboricola]